MPQLFGRQAARNPYSCIIGLFGGRAKKMGGDIGGGFFRYLPRADQAWRVVEELKVQMDRVRFLSLPQATPQATPMTSIMTSIIAQHRDIADAIASRLREQAEQAMRAHLSEILISLPVLAADPGAHLMTADIGSLPTTKWQRAISSGCKVN